MLETTVHPTAAGREFLTRAWEHWADNDLPQASEKGWNAAVAMVQAASAERDWAHDTHRVLFRNVRRLIDQTGDEELAILFGMAHNLHINSYENWFHPDFVRHSLQGVQTLLNKLEPLLETPP